MERDIDGKMVLILANNVQKLNAGEGHVKIHNIQSTNGLTAVVSVYNQVKPSHMILDELCEWAEVHSPEVAKKIEELAKDMSWN